MRAVAAQAGGPVRADGEGDPGPPAEPRRAARPSAAALAVAVAVERLHRDLAVEAADPGQLLAGSGGANAKIAEKPGEGHSGQLIGPRHAEQKRDERNGLAALRPYQRRRWCYAGGHGREVRGHIWRITCYERPRSYSERTADTGGRGITCP